MPPKFTAHESQMMDGWNAPHYKMLAPQIKQNAGDGEAGVMRFRFTTSTIDRGGHSMSMEGMQCDALKSNPVFLWMHDLGACFGNSMPAIGNLLMDQLEVTGSTAEVPAKFDLEDKFAKDLYGKYQRKVLRAVSIGWMPLAAPEMRTIEQPEPKSEGEPQPGENQYLYWPKWEWFELSAVNVGMNPEALAKMNAGGGLNLDLMVKRVVMDVMGELEQSAGGILSPGHSGGLIKAVIPYKKFPLAPEDTKWSFSAADGNEILGDPPNWKRFQSVHTWYDAEDKETRSSYKMPHHKMIDGSIKTVWKGCAAAMGALMGARGGMQIPADEMSGCREHLAQHYKEFDKEAPEMKAYSQEELKSMFADIWDGELKEYVEAHNVKKSAPDGAEADIARAVKMIADAAKILEQYTDVDIKTIKSDREEDAVQSVREIFSSLSELKQAITN